ncbi:MAG TPA: hypothetical protein VFH83_04275, partial [Spirochaetia bacterium]|nr:hypothetical protein [Spirochaetia bacterium]
MASSPAQPVLEQASIRVEPGDLDSTTGCTVTGAVRSVRLSGPERDASTARGGSQNAGAFDGGLLTARVSPPARAPGERRELSFYLRARDPSGRWEAPLLSEYGPSGHLRFAVVATAAAIVFELRTDWRDTPLRMEVPLSLIGGTTWHDIVGRYNGPHAELLVDGALVDEEWPIGALPGRERDRILIAGREEEGRAAGGFQGLLGTVAVWDRWLADPEVEALCGGAAAVAARGWTLEEPSDRVQYRYDRGGGFVGDCLPFFHEGTYHFYHLFDRRHHGSKFGLGAHQWAHSSSRDLVHWQHHPLAIPITEEREGSVCTGSMFFHDGTWYGFYATRLPDRSEHLSLATSGDGIHFTKTEPNPFASPKPPYRHGPFRDPHVFRDEKTGLFHMMVTAELERPAVPGRGGCLAHLVSRDLRHWEQEEPFLVTGYGDQPECSELYLWRGWYYLVFSHYGLAHYRMARSPFGPW